MIVETRYYALGNEHSAQEWSSIVATLAQGQKSGEQVVEQTYLDTFDWALCRNDISFIYEQTDASHLRIMTDQRGVKTPAPQTVEHLPVFPDDIPAGKMQKTIAKMVGLRALIPLAQLKSEQIIIHVEDKKGRVRIRLVVEVNFQRPAPRRKMLELGCRLRIECLKGYEKDFAKTLPRFAGLTPSSQKVFFGQIMENIGKTPMDYSSKLKIKLDRDMRADEALKTILKDQLAQIETNIDGTIANTDTEFLHDLRVAVRRSRSALSRLKGVLPPSIQDRFSQELAWIGSITTPVRDLDVYLLDYPKYRDQLSPQQQENLQPLYYFLLKQHEMARHELIDNLNSRRFRDFLVKWRAFLDKPVPQRPSAPVAAQEIGTIADKRIWKTYTRVIAEGSAIHEDTPAAALHDLRKTCKKLRYLLEFFASLYPANQVSELVKTLKGLQENLGDFQDLDVQAGKLHDFSAQMMQDGEDRPQVFMSMGVLVEGFMSKKEIVRTEFAERFASFSSKAVEKDFRQLVNKDKAGKQKVALKAHIENDETVS
ncbi:CHAD domain-containing protein [Terasakiella brassicae]|uniref:CHAD domain-containing protein n=1 Tax=Terasakiella brassicae TaxID=1634917 RepID=A0A917BY13_9PROT|nr:CHAD domain-containing protein [Terasakiella brassicae]GGF62765.1 CHAD domain-containing protein [Terasakiella brassicae]